VFDVLLNRDDLWLIFVEPLLYQCMFLLTTALKVANTLKSLLSLLDKDQTQSEVGANNFETPNVVRMFVTSDVPRYIDRQYCTRTNPNQCAC
jgi:hypothetical protein